ncbi:MAG TPA: prepilin-type N-terminal cleavage/methylation domain-containing protein [Polyangiaceae bacterium]|nr:prepilin-type N-terminal cleavage/methylation domain-containing protein [Polyangiaceae bacterium]
MRRGQLRRARGMTLIEILIVIALIALLLGTMVFGSGLFGGANRRAAATLIVAGVRKGLAHANTTGKPVRLALDLAGGRIVLEQASSKEAFVGEEAEEEEEEDPSAAALMLADAEALAEQVLSGGGKHDPGFATVDVLGQDGEGPGRWVGSGVKIVKVQTEHDEDPLVDGIAYVYFWPGGMTERAIVQIATSSNDESGLTIEISPLTGRAEIKRGLLDFPESRFGSDDAFSEREEL